MTSLNDFFPLYHTILRYQFYGLFSYTNPFPVTITPLLQSLKTNDKTCPFDANTKAVCHLENPAICIECSYMTADFSLH